METDGKERRLQISTSNETKRRRVDASMSIQTLSDKSGIHPNTLNNIEKGGVGVYSYSIIKGLADAFGVKVYEMAGEPIYDVRPTVLMSSASMPNDGFYVRESMSLDCFIRIVRGAWLIGNLKSYIGYDSTSGYIERITGAKVSKTRAKTTLPSGTTCQIAICKLRFRLSDKSELYIPHEDDFEYVRALYNLHTSPNEDEGVC